MSNPRMDYPYECNAFIVKSYLVFVLMKSLLKSKKCVLNEILARCTKDLGLTCGLRLQSL